MFRIKAAFIMYSKLGGGGEIEGDCVKIYKEKGDFIFSTLK